jgi:hypothetical protein
VAFDFPASPADGATFAPSGGPSYVFSNGVWKLAGGGTSFVVVSDTPPVNPFPGQLWFESDTGALFFWYVDADSSQWVQINFTPSGVNTAQTRNRIVNGAMQISQENGNTAGTAIGYYVVDQWGMTLVTTGAVSIQRVQVTTPNGSKDRIRLTVTTADTSLAAGEFVYVRQDIEGSRVADFRYGTALAKQAVLRFGFKAPAGTYALSLQNSAQSRSYIALFTITAGQANVDTEQILVIPGDMTGTWLNDNGAGFRLIVTVATGSTRQGSLGWNAGDLIATSAISNGLATTGNIFELFDVGLYLDPLATGVPPAWQMPDEAQELTACQRYWQKNLATNFSGNATSAFNYKASCPIVVPFRSAPALSGTNNFNNGFPATVGSLAMFGSTMIAEDRLANASGSGGFGSVVTANARM